MPEQSNNATDATKATDTRHPLSPSHASHEGFIPPHGGYEKLFSYPKTQIIYVRKLGRKPNLSYEDFREFIETRPAETVANILISLIHQANYLLDQQLRRLEKDFLEQGGLRERMTRARLVARARQSRRGGHD